MSRFVKKEIVRLPISGGDFITVKKRLNTGEKNRLMAKLVPFQTPGQPLRVDSEVINTSKVLIYLVGWSLMDDGKPVRFDPDMPELDRLAVLNNLDPDTFTEIVKAIDAHEDAEDAAREQEKNGKDGASESSAISPSVESLAGATSGSTS